LAAADFDGDGHADIVVGETDARGRLLLLRGTGTGDFGPPEILVGADSTNAAPLTGVLPADIDGDGDLDLYLLRWGGNELLLNDGSGGFRTRDSLRGKPSGLEDEGLAVTGVFFDADQDGDLDLDLVNLVDSAEPVLKGAHRFYRNVNGRFVDDTSASGLSSGALPISLSVSDIDGDGSADMIAVNWMGPAELYRNSGSGHFTLASRDSAALGHLGCDSADLDGDLRPDLLITAIGHPQAEVEPTHCLLSSSPTRDLSAALGLGRYMMTAFPHFGDFDNDGKEDLALGSTVRKVSYPLRRRFDCWVELQDDSVHFPQPRFPQAASPETGKQAGEEGGGREQGEMAPGSCSRWTILHNRGSGWMEEFAAFPVSVASDSRGILWVDADEDNRPDLLVNEAGGRLALYLNRNDQAGRGLAVRIRSRKPNCMGIGADVYLRTAHSVQMRAVKPGCPDFRNAEGMVHFGIGQDEGVEVAVRWPHGGWQASKIRDRKTMQERERIDVVEEAGRVRKEPPSWLRDYFDEEHAPKGESGAVTSAPAGRAGDGDLFRMERSLLEDPTNFARSWCYLQRCREQGMSDRPILFLRGQDEGRGPFAWGLQRSLAYLNAMGSAGNDIGRMAQLAGFVAYELERLRRLYPGTWLVEYSLGASLLYWPPFFGELNHAQDALEGALQLTQGRKEPHLAETFVALGDVFVLKGEEPQARAIWTEGLGRFPANPGLARRLALRSEEVRSFCEAERSMRRIPEAQVPWIEEEIPYCPLARERMALREEDRSTGPGSTEKERTSNLSFRRRALQQRLRESDLVGEPNSACSLALEALSLKTAWPHLQKGLACLEEGLTLEHMGEAEIALERFCLMVQTDRQGPPTATGPPADSSSRFAAELGELLRSDMLRVGFCLRGDAAVKQGDWRGGIQFYRRARQLVPDQTQYRLRDLLPLATEPSELWSPRFYRVSPCEGR
jgi:hypothetical protein